MMQIALLFTFIIFSSLSFGQFAPPVGEDGTTAIYKDSSAIVAWATVVTDFTRGPEDITNPDGTLASFGESTAALHVAEGNSTDVVSLGDGGSITLSFDFSIRNDAGPDFAVFENSFSDDYLEFAHVEVSSDGERFVRIPSISNIPTDEQTGSYATSDPTKVHNLAGKYRQGYGTPFDLEDIIDSVDIDLNDINYVRIVDVVGTINPEYGTRDSEGNLINDPYKTDFESGGFDLDAVAVLNSNDPTLRLPENQLSVMVYPNPTNGLLHISATTEIKMISMMDLSGRIIEVNQQDKFTVDLHALGLEKGVYFVIITDLKGEVFKQRIILQ